MEQNRADNINYGGDVMADTDQDSKLEIHKYSNTSDEDTLIQKEIDELNKEKEHLLKKRSLEEKRLELLEEKESIKEEIEDTKRGIKPIGRDTSVFWNILLLIVLVLLAGGLIAEGKLIGRYAFLLLIPVAILIFKVLDRFKNK